ncbi:hypothetical protein [Klebsiella pneumoniae]|uniref:hypothetical protein n=1 Tax=Klebsiella pneumoniae TaxID=573 RepID=UPI0020307404|nr:hypothetical protein [Klebsiella pneumoniae]URU47601.1 hypothetical protein NBY30_28895 [Klebsiella pneumoniae]
MIYFAALDGVGSMVDTLLEDMEGFVTSLPTLPDALSEWMDRLNRFKGPRRYCSCRSG